MKTRDTRATAARVLAEVMAGTSLNQALPAGLEQVAERDRALLQQLSYGTLRLYPRLLGVLQQLLDKPLRDKDRDVQALLLLGLYQLEATRVPDHAAVAATVAATRELAKPWAKGLCNAILRRYLREREALNATLKPAAAAAHPAWLYQRLQQDWPEDWAGIVDANNQQPPMTLRLNCGKRERAAYLALLAEQGIAARAGTLTDTSIYLEQARDVSALPGFAQGAVSVQDEAAQIAARLLAPAPGERILDACAAPGGKSCHLLELQPALRELVAMDIDPQRLEKVAQNLDRLGLTASLLAGDGAQPPATLARSSFDAILVDAPCSASGVIRRHPDVKLLRRERDIAQLAAQQLAILQGLWPLLRPGGRLLYATCSILEQENSAVIAQFLASRNDVCTATLDVAWGRPRGDGRQLLPSAGGPDGLFYALLTRAE